MGSWSKEEALKSDNSRFKPASSFTDCMTQDTAQVLSESSLLSPVKCGCWWRLVGWVWRWNQIIEGWHTVQFQVGLSRLVLLAFTRHRLLLASSFSFFLYLIFKTFFGDSLFTHISLLQAPQTLVCYLIISSIKHIAWITESAHKLYWL